ncbi:DUF4407 domain-containing protein [Nocardia nova]|nr:DUF4407 domain-containing protein [Nocardia nova]
MTDPHVPGPDMSGPAAARSGRAPKSLTGVLTWLGGAEAERPDRRGSAHEGSAYAVTGTVVLLFAVISGAVVSFAAAAAHRPGVIAVIAGIIAALLVGAVSRALATAPLSRRAGPRARAERFGRIAVAVLTGVIVAELASTVILGGSVARTLDDRARRDAESAASVVTARTELDRLTAERGALAATIAGAQTDMDQALIVARCEYNPTPQCPQTKITGVPGRGPETRTAESMLEDARGRLSAAQARVQPLDEQIAGAQTALDRARTAAFRTGDRGPGARWLAMNEYTTGHAGGLLLRLLTLVVAVLLALLPLLLRIWRGESSFDRAVAAGAEIDRADRAADTAVAVKRAQIRSETESLRAEQELTATRLAVDADTTIDRERQRTRVLAAIGNLEIGVTEPQQRAVADFEALAALPPSTDPTTQEATVTAPRHLPAPVTPAALAPAEPARTPEKTGGLELPVIGTVPFTDTAARWIRPLVPGFVTTALDRTIDTATSPLRTVRQVFEEAEEITFTLKRTRKVTVNSEDSHGAAAGQVIEEQHLPPAAPRPPHYAYLDDPRYAYQHDPRYARYAPLPHQLPHANPDAALTGSHATELGYPDRRELPPGPNPS